ncbi:MAG: ComEC/Rec2 family competence protein, partial [Synergistaceae bacterium]|nr:ComEC/Rec2 family competence protein [Synergistaceae bacterium]
MIILTRAPFLVILAGLTAALAADGSVVWAIPPIALVVVLGTMLVSFRVTLRGQRSVAAAVLIVALCCSSWVAFSLSRRPVLPSFVQAEGVVVESRPWGRLYAVSVNTKEGGFLLKLPFGELVEGQRVRVEGTPKPFKGTVSGGSASGSDFREDRFWYARGMTAQLTSARFEPLRQSGGLRDWSVHRWRYGLFRSLTLHMPSLTGAYLNAAWTGKRDKDLNEKHKLFGTSHLLAVSGFHVGLLMLGASLVFR